MLNSKCSFFVLSLEIQGNFMLCNQLFLDRKCAVKLHNAKLMDYVKVFHHFASVHFLEKRSSKESDKNLGREKWLDKGSGRKNKGAKWTKWTAPKRNFHSKTTSRISFSLLSLKITIYRFITDHNYYHPSRQISLSILYKFILCAN
jgi:hypothetical protein